MDASTTAPPDTGPDRRFEVLVVGARNVVRSRAAEVALRAAFADDAAVRVGSAGTHVEDEIPFPDPLAALLEPEGLTVDEHTPRALDPELVTSADLVVTMTRAERAAVVRMVPGSVRRTFTVRELARVSRLVAPSALPGGGPAERLAALVAQAGPHRGPTMPADPEDDDVVDPSRDDPTDQARAVQEVRTAVDTVVAAVLGAPGSADDEPDAPAPAVAPPHTVRTVRTPRRPHRRARAVTVAILTTLIVLVSTVTVGALVVLGRLDSRVERFPDPFAGLPSRPSVPPQPDRTSDAQPVTILVLGSTEDVATGGSEQWASAAALTDVVMLAHVAGDRRSAQLVAMPPDLEVDVPGAGRGPLRSAIATGGPARAVQTVEQLTDVRVDHVALTDSDTFARVTEALGGVDLTLPTDLVDDGRMVVPAGRHRLDGAQALRWVQGSATDDPGRSERQQTWLRAILDRLGDDDVRRSPSTWLELLGAVSGSVAVDEGLDRATMVGLLTSVRGLRPADVDVVAVPTTTALDAGGGTVQVPDEQPFEALMAALRTDTLGTHLGTPTVTG